MNVGLSHELFLCLSMFEEWCRFSGRQAGLRTEGSHQALQRDLHRAQQEDRAVQGTNVTLVSFTAVMRIQMLVENLF
jgi:hypothetical protein